MREKKIVVNVLIYLHVLQNCIMCCGWILAGTEQVGEGEVQAGEGLPLALWSGARRILWWRWSFGRLSRRMWGVTSWGAPSLLLCSLQRMSDLGFPWAARVSALWTNWGDVSIGLCRRGTPGCVLWASLSALEVLSPAPSLSWMHARPRTSWRLCRLPGRSTQCSAEWNRAAGMVNGPNAWAKSTRFVLLALSWHPAERTMSAFRCSVSNKLK